MCSAAVMTAAIRSSRAAAPAAICGRRDLWKASSNLPFPVRDKPWQWLRPPADIPA
jgi:hypothetical protein